jgi:predicted nucleic acid-binding Zn ribbon protein
MSSRDRKEGPVRLGRILPGVLSECGLAERLADSELLAAWPQLVGERLAAHVRAVDLRDGVLVLAAGHGAWRQEASLLLPEIQRRCNARFGAGAVTEIRWARAWTSRPPADNEH